MAKVDFPDGISPYFTPAAYAGVSKDDKKVKARIKSTPFSKLLESAESKTETEIQSAALEASEENLRLLLDDVHETGEELKQKPVPDNIKRYRAAVRSFLHYIVQNSYTSEELIIGVNIKTRKKFTLVQIIDQKLEQLAAGILIGQKSQLDILARIDEINGLLVDLTL